MMFTNIRLYVDSMRNKFPKKVYIQKLKHSILTQKDVLIYVKANQDSKLYFDVGNLL